MGGFEGRDGVQGVGADPDHDQQAQLVPLVLTGAYEIIGSGHHFVMWAYRSQRVGLVPDRFTGHHVSAVRQERWERLEPHPTDMPILNDAGAAAYPRQMIASRLAGEQTTMTSLLTGEVFGPLPRAVAPASNGPAVSPASAERPRNAVWRA